MSERDSGGWRLRALLAGLRDGLVLSFAVMILLGLLGFL